MITYTCNRCGISQKGREGGERFFTVRKPVSGEFVDLCSEHKKLWDEVLWQWWKEVDQKMEDWLNQSTRSGE